MLVISTLVIVNVLNCCFKYAGLLFTRYQINTNICNVAVARFGVHGRRTRKSGVTSHKSAFNNKNKHQNKT